MSEPNTVFVGCDLGDKFTEVCILDPTGAVVENARIRTTKKSIVGCLKRFGRARVVLEVGMHSRWVAAALTEAGHEVVVANPRQVRLIWKRPRKTDRSDALMLAKLGRVDVALLAPVRHRSHAAQVDLASLRARDILVRVRTKLVTHVQGSLKAFGVRVESCHPPAFPEKAEEALPPELLPVFGAALDVIRVLNGHIAAADKQVEQLATTLYPQSSRCTQVTGIGALTALAYMLTMEDPTRFKKSRFAAAFFGLTPGKDQSGMSDPQKRITKAGDPFVRRLLVQCAQYFLGPFGQDSDLRRWGLKMAERGGKNGKKRAVVAVARKLAVLMHRLWVSGEEYEPLGYAQKKLAA
jgi:transposase